MKIEKFAVQSCCGTASVAFKLDTPISKAFLPLLVDKGYTAPSHFTKAGILYVENEGLIATGAFGSDILQIKCRIAKDKCEKFINTFEEILIAMG